MAGPSGTPLPDDLQKLYERIKTLFTRDQEFRLHPSKCRCLLQSYRFLLECPFTRRWLINPHVLGPFMRVLLHTIQEGVRFLEDCTFLPGWKELFNSTRREWLINKAVPSALSTEILDVHLHDFLGCIFTLIRMVDPKDCFQHESQDGLKDIQDSLQKILASADNEGNTRRLREIFATCTTRQGLQLGLYRQPIFTVVKFGCRRAEQDRLNEIEAVEDGILKIWASADDEGDTRRMRELFTNIKSKELEEICKLVGRRLSTRTSKAHLNPADAIDTLWLDPPGFDLEMVKTRAWLSCNPCEVLRIKSMGGQFACKRFQQSGSVGFRNEAVIQASLQHANVMHLLWCTKRPGSQSLVMELMAESLGQVIARRMQAKMKPLFSLLAGIDIMLQIAKGMEYLHEWGIIHRDLKSSNILVRHSGHLDNSDQLLSVKIADFGSSMVKHNNRFFTTKRVGTSIWIAPEVMDTEDETKYTNKADVYSFAIVCSEILTGLPPDKLLPFERSSELLKIVKGGRRPQLPSSCPPAIANYIKTCWDGDASKRPTFKHTCKVFRAFKACLLSGRTELLGPSLPNMFNGVPFYKRLKGPIFRGTLYHPVLGMLLEMRDAVTMAQSGLWMATYIG